MTIYCIKCGRRFYKLIKLQNHMWYEENELTDDEIKLIKWLARCSYLIGQ